MKLLITFILSGFIAASSFACSCSEESIAESYKHASSVALVVPTDSGKYYTTVREDNYSFDLYKTGVKVVKYYKGKYSKFFYLLAEPDDTGANCGVSFKPYNGVYLVFSYPYNSKYYTTSGCSVSLMSYTAETEEAQTEYRQEVDRILKELDRLSK